MVADDRVGGRLGDLDATLGHPGPVKKVVLAAEGLVVGRGGVKTCEERIRKVTMVRFHIQAGEKYLKRRKKESVSWNKRGENQKICIWRERNNP